MQRRGQSFTSPSSRTDCVRDKLARMDNSRLRIDCGHFASTVTACSRTIEVVACARTGLVRERDCWRGLNANTGFALTRTICFHVLFPTGSRSRICRVRGHEPHTSCGRSALLPRLLRGRRILSGLRSKACPVLNMMRNTLPPLLQHLVAPLFQLRGDSLDARGLFNGPHLGSPGRLVVQSHVRHLGDRGSCGFVDSFAEHF